VAAVKLIRTSKRYIALLDTAEMFVLPLNRDWAMVFKRRMLT
jgi:hypothetical protein